LDNPRRTPSSRRAITLRSVRCVLKQSWFASLLLVAQTFQQSATVVGGLPRRGGVGLGADRVVLGEQHAEQDELRRLHVEHVGIERALAELLGHPEELRVELAGELETRRR